MAAVFFNGLRVKLRNRNLCTRPRVGRLLLVAGLDMDEVEVFKVKGDESVYVTAPSWKAKDRKAAIAACFTMGLHCHTLDPGTGRMKVTPWGWME